MQDNDIDEPVFFDRVTYKPESTMLVESQELLFAVRLAQLGYNVTIKERATVVEELKTTYGDLFEYECR